ncbi:Protein of unknown function [Cotesia congregata]|uniref:Uncharacterized protein n=1 Tax=Cotesia congregata TaxID=51543 RepID=A0A8J2HDJ7_COTCN|nr:Protein of unknown function [Cotesia congregata]
MLKTILLLSISCALGIFVDNSRELCKQSGLLCKNHTKCCSGVCYKIGNIGWWSSIQVPETTTTSTTTPKSEIYSFNSYNYRCDSVIYMYMVNKHCCSRNCYRSKIITIPGMCVV